MELRLRRRTSAFVTPGEVLFRADVKTETRTLQFHVLRYGPDPLRQDLAQQLGSILGRSRGYVAIAKKVLQVEALPEGALPIYDRKPS